MSKERVEKLIAALRSGEYTQSSHILKSKLGHCCLGVACEVYAKENNKGYWNDKGYFVTSYSEFSRTELTYTVKEWYGFTEEDPILVDGVTHHKMVHLNDGLKWSFLKIADLLEKNLEREISGN